MRTTACIPALALTLAGQAQNLVPNPSFEDFVTCPNTFNQLAYATGWLALYATSDYYNACDAGTAVSVPSNAIGYQPAASGQAYAGVVTYYELGSVPDPEHSKEFIGAQLTQVLQPGVPVYLSFKISPTGIGNLIGASPRWTVEGFGMRFSTVPAYNGMLDPPNSAALFIATPPTDTVNWIIVSGVYVPDSAYQYVMLGNFFSDSTLTPVLFNPNGDAGAAYVFIDDVCVSTDSGSCFGSVGVRSIDGPGATVWPNPFEDVLTIRLSTPSNGSLEIHLTDLLGRKVWHGFVQPEQGIYRCRIPPELPAGKFVLHVLPHGTDELIRPLLVFHRTTQTPNP